MATYGHEGGHGLNADQRNDPSADGDTSTDLILKYRKALRAVLTAKTLDEAKSAARPHIERHCKPIDFQWMEKNLRGGLNLSHNATVDLWNELAYLRDHGCFTGDCPHSNSDQCVNSILTALPPIEPIKVTP